MCSLISSSAAPVPWTPDNSSVALGQSEFGTSLTGVQLQRGRAYHRGLGVVPERRTASSAALSDWRTSVALASPRIYSDCNMVAPWSPLQVPFLPLPGHSRPPTHSPKLLPALGRKTL